MKLYLLIFVTLIFCELPYYASNIIVGFDLDYRLMKKWSYTESTHCKYAHKAERYGRYGIGIDLLKDYCRYTKQNINDISDPIEFLKNDYNNCYISYWMCNWYLERGYSYMWFFQRWLWGEKNLRKGHWSWSYHKKIFGKDLTNFKKYSIIK